MGQYEAYVYAVFTFLILSKDRGDASLGGALGIPKRKLQITKKRFGSRCLRSKETSFVLLLTFVSHLRGQPSKI